jgi:hypothetical protein
MTTIRDKLARACGLDRTHPSKSASILLRAKGSLLWWFTSGRTSSTSARPRRRRMKLFPCVFLGHFPTSSFTHTFQKTYVCTSDAARNGYCNVSQLGQFILDLPAGKSINDTSFYTARLKFSGSDSSNLTTTSSLSANSAPPPAGGFWDNPAGNPVLPEDESANTSPWKRELSRVYRISKAGAKGSVHSRTTVYDNASPSGILVYRDPIHYHVHKTGYYCVGASPSTARLTHGYSSFASCCSRHGTRQHHLRHDRCSFPSII